MNLVPPPPARRWKHGHTGPSYVFCPGTWLSYRQHAGKSSRWACTRLAIWQPNGRACPLHGVQETVHHATLSCKFLEAAFRFARRQSSPQLLCLSCTGMNSAVSWSSPKRTPYPSWVCIALGCLRDSPWPSTSNAWIIRCVSMRGKGGFRCSNQPTSTANQSFKGVAGIYGLAGAAAQYISPREEDTDTARYSCLLPEDLLPP